jgi:transcriptional regulator with XRE-family HTH domain
MSLMPRDAQAPTLDQVVGVSLRAFREEDGLTQDALAWRLRSAGLPWSRSTVAQLEAGTKTLDVAELVLLSLVVRRAPEAFFGGAEWMELRPGTRMRSDAVRRALGGERAWKTVGPGEVVGAHGGPTLSAMTRNALLAWGVTIKDAERRSGRYERIIPRLTLAQLQAARDAAEGDAERKAARRLGLDDPVELALAAIALWGHSLTEERDRRLEPLVPDIAKLGGSNLSAGARTLQATRGHITRRLLDELAPVLRPSKAGKAISKEKAR